MAALPQAEDSVGVRAGSKMICASGGPPRLMIGSQISRPARAYSILAGRARRPDQRATSAPAGAARATAINAASTSAITPRRAIQTKAYIGPGLATTAPLASWQTMV